MINISITAGILFIFALSLNKSAKAVQDIPSIPVYLGPGNAGYPTADAAGQALAALVCNAPGNQSYFQSCTYAGLRTDIPDPDPTSPLPFAGRAMVTLVRNGSSLTMTAGDVRETFSCPAGNWSLRWLPNNPIPVCEGSGTAPPPQPSLQITASAAFIPAGGTTQNGKILTKSNLTLRVTQAGQSVSGMSVGLQSSRGSQDAIQGPTAATNASGTSTASVSTRAQPGQSTISGSSPSNLQTTNQANISWLPARYEHSFLVTCYTLAVEAEAPATPISHNVCGLPSANHYRSKFLTDVKMQGSGQALDGTIVHYRGQGCFNTDTCARTATGACATVGTTIAVDRSVIPKGGSVTVDILGQRKAQDGGGWINGYHIDDYMGPQRAACLQLGTRNSGIVFQSY